MSAGSNGVDALEQNRILGTQTSSSNQQAQLPVLPLSSNHLQQQQQQQQQQQLLPLTGVASVTTPPPQPPATNQIPSIPNTRPPPLYLTRTSNQSGNGLNVNILSSFRPYIPPIETNSWCHRSTVSLTPATFASSSSPSPNLRRAVKSEVTSQYSHFGIVEGFGKLTFMHTHRHTACNKSSSLISATKRRKPEEPDENMVRIPLRMGWKRITHIRLITKTGVRGDVVYFSPDNKKLKSFQEIDRYLLKNPCTALNGGALNRQNFTFSSKFLVGTFVRHSFTPNNTGTRSEELTEEQVIKLIRKENPNFQRTDSNTIKRKPQTQSNATIRNFGTTNLLQQLTDVVHSYSSNGKERRVQRYINRTTVRGLAAPKMSSIACDNLFNQRRVTPPKTFFSKSTASSNKNGCKRPSDGGDTGYDYSEPVSTSWLPRLSTTTTSERCSCPVFIRKQHEEDIGASTLMTKGQGAFIYSNFKECVNDLLIKDAKPLPDFEPIPGTEGFDACCAFGNCFMACELLATFKDRIVTWKTDRPSRSTQSMLAFDSLTAALMMMKDSIIIENLCMDLVKYLKCIGHFHHIVDDLPIDEYSLSAVLFYVCGSGQRCFKNLHDKLFHTTFRCLNLKYKSQALRWLCDEFLTNRLTYSWIDDDMNAFNEARRRPSRDDVRAKLGLSHNIPFGSGSGGEGRANDAMDELSGAETAEDTKLHPQEQFRTAAMGGLDLARLRNFGSDRYYRRYWFVPRQNAIYIESTDPNNDQVLLRDVEAKPRANSSEFLPIISNTSNGKETNLFIDPVIDKSGSILHDPSNGAIQGNFNDDGVMDMSLSGRTTLLLSILSAADNWENNACHHRSTTSLDELVNYRLQNDRAHLARVNACPVRWCIFKDKDTLKKLLDSLCNKGERERALYLSLSRELELLNSCLKHDTQTSCTDDFGGGTFGEVVKSSKWNDKLLTFWDQNSNFDHYCLLVVCKELRRLQRRIHLAKIAWCPSKWREKKSEDIVHNAENPSSMKLVLKRLLSMEESIQRRYLNEKNRSKIVTWREDVAKCVSVSILYNIDPNLGIFFNRK
ncbi:hypothetical protein ACOME3_009876 [Neoechinorhynchus agilis]